MYFAHSVGDETSCWQELAEHLHCVADLAGSFAQPFGAERAARAAGLLHDLGKWSPAFADYLLGRGPSPDHSTAGAKEVLGLAVTPSDRLMTQLVAYAIAGHHAGLPDRAGGPAALDGRLLKTLPQLDPAWRTSLPVEATELMPVGLRASGDPRAQAFQLAFLGRMLFSALVDADYLDTERFYAQAAGTPVDRAWPALGAIIDPLQKAFDAHMAAKAARAAERSPGIVNDLRTQILRHARGKATLPPGVFTLDVPTGGGKTLASLGFALDHAKAYGLRRIVYAIPFTSVIDQTVAVFREVLGDDVVLEHHSAIENRRTEEGSGGGPDAPARSSRDKLRLAMENWAAPVVVTTNVQLFESLFAARPSRCRKLHNLARSVIVLDEVQTIPLPVLRPAVAALNELALNYGVSVVLCTATQPALREKDADGTVRFERGFAVSPDRELAPSPPDLHRRLKRVTLLRAGTLSDAALIDGLAEVVQGLVIVNGRRHALELYRAAAAAGLDGLVHLTTRQTAADRRLILDEVRRRLDPAAPRPCRLIATSLVEAGVDIDFPRVWRAACGLDQLMQAAGRCNREGTRRAEDSIVTVFTPAEAKPPYEIKKLIEAFETVAGSHDDLLSPEAIQHYFRQVYWQAGSRTAPAGSDGLDEIGAATAWGMSAGRTDFPYRSIAERFRLIRDGMEPVIVARVDAARSALAALANGASPGRVARDLQAYVVQIPPRDRAAMIDAGEVVFADAALQFAVLREEKRYDASTGLMWERAGEIDTII